jgi:ethanolamine utilization cobalamin adenosyltransferase
MLYTRQAVKDNIRNRDGNRVFYLGKGDQLTSDARDFLNQERIAILPAEQAKPDRFRLLGGGYTEEKPEHMTHLNAEILVLKTHPRIQFRGAMDLLEAEILLCQLSADSKTKEELEQVLELARDLVRREVLNEPVPEKPLCGMDQQQLRLRSHRPQEFYGQPHFMPSAEDGTLILQINKARCAARAAELAAAKAFTDPDGKLLREDLLRALNRMSSMLYLIMIRLKAGK